jgi:hypothetical protein
MPEVIKMRLSNGNIIPHKMRDISKAIYLSPVPKTSPTSGVNSSPVPKTSPMSGVNSLQNSPMITRVHNVKPGCGSCGRS